MFESVGASDTHHFGHRPPEDRPFLQQGTTNTKLFHETIHSLDDAVLEVEKQLPG
jgi:hypothetical protein